MRDGRCPAHTVDWLVLMRRLPAQRMLDRLIAEGGVAAKTSTRWSACWPTSTAAPRSPATAGGIPGALPARAGGQPRGAVAAAVPPAAAPRQRSTASTPRCCGTAALLRDAPPTGRIVDGHGDLRPEHVCLLRPPGGHRLPRVQRRVAPGRSRSTNSASSRSSAKWPVRPGSARDSWPPALAAPGRCAAARAAAPVHRVPALLRARLAMAHLLDPQPRTPLKWAPLAQRYVDRSLAALASLETRPRGVLAPATARSAQPSRGTP